MNRTVFICNTISTVTETPSTETPSKETPSMHETPRMETPSMTTPSTGEPTRDPNYMGSIAVIILVALHGN